MLLNWLLDRTTVFVVETMVCLETGSTRLRQRGSSFSIACVAFFVALLTTTSLLNKPAWADARTDAANQVFAEALYLYQAGDFAGARKQFELGLRIDDKNPRAHYYLAETLMELDSYDNVELAHNHYMAAIRLGPETKEGILAAAKLPDLEDSLEQRKNLRQEKERRQRIGESRLDPYSRALEARDFGHFSGVWEPEVYSDWNSGSRKIRRPLHRITVTNSGRATLSLLRHAATLYCHYNLSASIVDGRRINFAADQSSIRCEGNKDVAKVYINKWRANSDWEIECELSIEEKIEVVSGNTVYEPLPVLSCRIYGKNKLSPDILFHRSQ